MGTEAIDVPWFIERNKSNLIFECVVFQESCPGAIHIVYVVAKKDSPILMFNTTKIKEQLNFEVSIGLPVLCAIRHFCGCIIENIL